MPLQHCHGYAAGIHHGLPTGDINRPKSSPPSIAVWVRVAARPRSARFEPLGLLRSFQTLVPHVRLSVLLPDPDHLAVLARPVVVRAAVHPNPPFQKVQAALSFNVSAATSTKRWPPTTARLENAWWRSPSATHRRSGPSASKLRSTRSAGRAASSSGMVVRRFSPLTTPFRPSWRISRSTVHRATPTPSR